MQQEALFQMLGVFAEFERSMIQDRIHAGLSRARKQKKRLGCPRVRYTTERAIRAARAEGMVAEFIAGDDTDLEQYFHLVGTLSRALSRLGMGRCLDLAVGHQKYVVEFVRVLKLIRSTTGEDSLGHDRDGSSLFPWE